MYFSENIKDFKSLLPSLYYNGRC